jgi:eukaryotic-like serine/threonine-protein kinase
MPDCSKCGRTYAASVRYCVIDGTDLGPAATWLGPGPVPAGAVPAVDGAPPDGAVASALEPGATLGNYRIVSLLGEGGMGQVFAAEHLRLGRKVAIKTLRPEFGRDPHAVSRFFSEARTVNQIRQEHIVEITDFVDDDPHHTYCVMELLEGRTVHEEILLAPGGLERSRAIAIAKQVAEAMAVVHETGVVHRDLKPANIFVTHRAGQSDWVKLLDFGIAKLQKDGIGAAGQAQTVAGSILGTPEYMSPEQASGKPVDHRTDIYALGIILFEMLTGSQPFRAGSLGEMVVQHLTVAPPRPSDCVPESQEPIPPELDALVLACLEKDPDDRPSTMAEVHARLAEAEAARTGGTAATATASSPAGAPATDFDNRAAPAAEAGVATGTEDDARALRSARPWIPVAALAGVGAVLLVFTIGRGGEGETVPLDATAAAAGPPEVVEEALPAEPEGPARVTVSLDSTPQGARVFRAGSEEPLGVTPLALDLPRADEEAAFALRLNGHLDAEARVSLSESSQISVVLEEEAPRRRPVTRTRRTRAQNEAPAKAAPSERPRPEFDPTGIIDPFDE